ncbi:IclR family transcriptional regulator, partial [Bacillus sp. AFS094228]
MTTEGKDARNSSASLRKALALLTVVAEEPGNGDGLALVELARLSGLNKSTLLRLAVPLLEENLL